VEDLTTLLTVQQMKETKIICDEDSSKYLEQHFNCFMLYFTILTHFVLTVQVYITCGTVTSLNNTHTSQLLYNCLIYCYYTLTNNYKLKINYTLSRLKMQINYRYRR
jgi:hypothetical protein